MNKEEKKPVIDPSLIKQEPLVVQPWLKARPNSTLGKFADIPNHTIICYILQFLNAKDLELNLKTSASFNKIIQQFKQTTAGVEIVDKFLLIQLKQIAKQHKITLSDTALTVNHVVANLDSSLERKRREVTTSAHTRRATIFEIVIICILLVMSSLSGGSSMNPSNMDCSGRNRLLPNWAINLLRVIFAGILAGSIYGLNTSVRSGGGEDNIEADVILGILITLTGGVLLYDGVQSLHTCYQERGIGEVKTRVATLQRRTQVYGSINQEAKGSIVDRSYVLLEDKPNASDTTNQPNSPSK